jgi:hypothetical protein
MGRIVGSALLLQPTTRKGLADYRSLLCLHFCNNNSRRSPVASLRQSISQVLECLSTGIPSFASVSFSLSFFVLSFNAYSAAQSAISGCFHNARLHRYCSNCSKSTASRHCTEHSTGKAKRIKPFRLMMYVTILPCHIRVCCTCAGTSAGAGNGMVPC